MLFPIVLIGRNIAKIIQKSENSVVQRVMYATDKVRKFIMSFNQLIILINNEMNIFQIKVSFLFFFQGWSNNNDVFSYATEKNSLEYSLNEVYDPTNYQYPNSYGLDQQAQYEPVNSHFSLVQGNLPSPRNRRQRNRRLFFNSGAFFNITRAFKSTIRSTVGKLLGPDLFFDGVLGVSALPPIVVLPLAFLAFGLLLREEIEDVITDKFCKYLVT